MDRLELEKSYWDTAAADSEVDIKYISDIDTQDCLRAILPYIEYPRVLDIGCGVGRMMIALHDLVAQSEGKKAYIEGIDISVPMLEIAEKRSWGKLLRYKQCDGRTIPYANDYFDSAYSMLLFQHLPLDAVLGYIKEAARVLKVGGIFRFQFIEGDEDEPFSKHHFWPLIREALEENGFDIKDHEIGLLHAQWSWITAKKVLHGGYLGDDNEFGATNGD